ncbi:glucoamylase family protein [Massilia sp. Se16.2.3]|uniref:glucoamylase family protein n=1 Tax=Massilia sp. Se16.2.3 TaxID=2709303 RepID=UPI0028042265|nr:glucoamylase family protein [Massilia sp. Se16.2.3]
MRAVQEYVLGASLTRIPTLRELAAYQQEPGADDAQRLLARMVEEGAATARARLEDIAELVRRAREFAEMEFAFLQRPDNGLLARGWQVDEDRLMEAGDGLLASQARLASFVGIAAGQLPARHWAALKRPLCVVDGEQLLLSPAGALSDYLAPLLVMPRYRGSLFDQACHAIVRVQVEHARRHSLPRGMSESACNSVDSALQYQTGTFGVPGTGCARGSADASVIAPYAGMLALMVAPQSACANLERLAQLGCMGEFGFYEALDCSAARLPRGQRHAVVRAFVGQHQAMGLLALSWLLRERPLQRHFEADARLRANLLLLQEPVPENGAFAAPRFEQEAAQAAPRQAHVPAQRLVHGPGATPVQLQLLSNGRYHVMVTSDGGGYSACGDLAITRWCGDGSGADSGLSCCLRDVDSGALWSAGWRPTLAVPDGYEACLSEGRVELRRRDHDILLATEIVVSPEDDIELRRMRVTNASSAARTLELTSHVPLAWRSAGAADALPWPALPADRNPGRARRHPGYTPSGAA